MQSCKTHFSFYWSCIYASIQFEKCSQSEWQFIRCFYRTKSMQTINNLKCVKFQSQWTLDFLFKSALQRIRITIDGTPNIQCNCFLHKNSITTHNLQTGFNNKEVKYEISLSITYTQIKENKPIQHGMMNERSMGYIAHEHENNMHDK